MEQSAPRNEGNWPYWVLQTKDLKSHFDISDSHMHSNFVKQCLGIFFTFFSA